MDRSHRSHRSRRPRGGIGALAGAFEFVKVVGLGVAVGRVGFVASHVIRSIDDAMVEVTDLVVSIELAALDHAAAPAGRPACGRVERAQPYCVEDPSFELSVRRRGFRP